MSSTNKRKPSSRKPKRYSIDYFITKFGAIPHSRWTTEVLSKGEARCAFGHCGGYHTAEAFALKGILEKSGENTVVGINDDYYKGYKHPRTRILHALRDQLKNIGGVK